jgi:hypothetical protein
MQEGQNPCLSVFIRGSDFLFRRFGVQRRHEAAVSRQIALPRATTAPRAKHIAFLLCASVVNLPYS